MKDFCLTILLQDNTDQNHHHLWHNDVHFRPFSTDRLHNDGHLRPFSTERPCMMNEVSGIQTNAEIVPVTFLAGASIRNTR